MLTRLETAEAPSPYKKRLIDLEVIPFISCFKITKHFYVLEPYHAFSSDRQVSMSPYLSWDIWRFNGLPFTLAKQA